MNSPPAGLRGDVIVHVFGRTDVGRTREHNEDAFVVSDLSTDNATLQPEVRDHVLGPKGTLFMVADGMGGAAAGEIASAMAVEVVLQELRTSWLADPSHSAEAFARYLKRATAAANAQINGYAAAHPEYRGMGTTATIAGILGDTLYLAQVGDSRAYLVRDGIARQITKDQSLMQKLIEAGELTEEEAEHSERRNIILQALGPESTVKVDLTHQRVRSGDTLVICSDGLSGQVSKETIGRVVGEEPDLMNVCKRLIDDANEAGGPDNITVIAARFAGAGLDHPDHRDEVGHREFPLPETGQTPAMGIDRIVPEIELLDLETPDALSLPGAAAAITARTTVPTRATVPLAPDVMPVSPARRRAGQVITVVLGLLLVGAVVWYVVHAARTTVPSTTSGAAHT